MQQLVFQQKQNFVREALAIEQMKELTQFIMQQGFTDYQKEYVYYVSILETLNVYDHIKNEILQSQGFQRFFVATILYNGWFLFSTQNILFPKLDITTRTFLNLDDFDPIRILQYIKQKETALDKSIKYQSIRKRIMQIFNNRSNNFYMSINKNLQLVNEENSKFHKESWICKQLIDLLESYEEEPYNFVISSSVLKGRSFEIYQKDEEKEEIIAADIGYSVGGIYVSMSGFSDRKYSSMGIVQLIIQAILLKQMGFKYWDFGQNMEYKDSLMTTIKTQQETIEIYENNRSCQVQEIDHFKEKQLKNITEIQQFRQCFEYLEQEKKEKGGEKGWRKKHNQYQERKELERTFLVNQWNESQVQLWIKTMFKNVDHSIFYHNSQLADLQFIKQNVQFKKNQKKITWAYEKLVKVQKDKIKSE